MIYGNDIIQEYGISKRVKEIKINIKELPKTLEDMVSEYSVEKKMSTRRFKQWAFNALLILFAGLSKLVESKNNNISLFMAICGLISGIMGDIYKRSAEMEEAVIYNKFTKRELDRLIRIEPDLEKRSRLENLRNELNM